jgi:hypothetical protein
VDAEAATWLRAGEQLAAEQRHSLPHAVQAAPAARQVAGRCRPTGRVHDRQLDSCARDRDRGDRGGAGSVLDHVGQRLLTDPERRRLQQWRQIRDCPVEPENDGHPCGTDLLGDLAEVLECPHARAVVVAWCCTARLVELSQSRHAGPFDGVQRFLCTSGRCRGGHPCCTGLQGDEGQHVSYGVVQVLCGREPFLPDRCPPAELVVQLAAQQPDVQLLVLLPQQPGGLADVHSDGADDDQDRDETRRIGRPDPEGCDGQSAGRAHGDERGPATRESRCKGVQRDGKRDGRVEERMAQQQLQDERRPDHQRHRERPTPPGSERRDLQDRQDDRHRRRPRRRQARILPQGERQQECHWADRDGETGEACRTPLPRSRQAHLARQQHRQVFLGDAQQLQVTVEVRQGSPTLLLDRREVGAGAPRWQPRPAGSCLREHSVEGRSEQATGLVADPQPLGQGLVPAAQVAAGLKRFDLRSHARPRRVSSCLRVAEGPCDERTDHVDQEVRPPAGRARH